MLNDPVKGKLLLMPIHWALSAAFKTKTRDQWDQWFADKDACVSAILSPAEAIRHPLFSARDIVGEEQGQYYFKNPIKFQQTAESLAASPELGANNPS
jgi:crotonobetainyl-CoA:carnitine CoA-transferase CaiB-like acyl-CoA transferase